MADQAPDPMEASRPAWDAARARYGDDTFANEHDRALSQVAFTEGWAAHAATPPTEEAPRGICAAIEPGDWSGAAPRCSLLEGHDGDDHVQLPTRAFPVLRRWPVVRSVSVDMQRLRQEIADALRQHQAGFQDAELPDEFFGYADAVIRDAVQPLIDRYEQAGRALIKEIELWERRYLGAIDQAAKDRAATVDLISALADRDVQLPPLEEDRVAARLGLLASTTERSDDEGQR